VDLLIFLRNPIGVSNQDSYDSSRMKGKDDRSLEPRVPATFEDLATKAKDMGRHAMLQFSQQLKQTSIKKKKKGLRRPLVPKTNETPPSRMKRSKEGENK
jgi:hypothetical protein